MTDTLTPMSRYVLDEEILELLQDLLMEGQTEVTQNFDDGEPVINAIAHKIKNFKNRSDKFPPLQLNSNILTGH